MVVALLDRLKSEDSRRVRVIVSDNASDDLRYCKLQAICAAHPLRIELRRHAKPVTALLNFWSLLENLDTEYACYLADDDYWDPAALTGMVAGMNSLGLDFAYAKEWSRHDRGTGTTLGREKMYDLKGDRMANLIQLIRYDNDPHVYGVYRTNLLKAASQRFRQSWSGLPTSYIWDTAFEALGFVFLSTDKVDFLPYHHSQGVLALGVARSPALPKKVWGLLKRTCFHFIQKPQLYLSLAMTVWRMGFGISQGLRILGEGAFATARRVPVIEAIQRRIILSR